jgi:hypothetical protein
MLAGEDSRRRHFGRGRYLARRRAMGHYAAMDGAAVSVVSTIRVGLYRNAQVERSMDP